MDRLEKAAEMLMASPDMVTHEQRHTAEQVFLQLRQTKSPFNLCREILETSSVPYLLFEAASLLRVGIIREWHELNPSDRQQLRTYIMQYVLGRPDQPHYIRETLVQVVAIMIKRGSVEDGGEERGQVLTEVEQLIRSTDVNMRVIGCSVVSALMQEYAVTVKSTDVGITWETHFRAKKQFEGTDLRRIFLLVTQLLSEGVARLEESKETAAEPALRTMLHRMLILAESTLTWSFISLHLPKRLMSVFEQDQNPPLRPGPHWEDIFKDNSLVQLFFKVYWLLRGDWELGHHALSCIVQLASLNGVTLINKETRIAYLQHYLTCLFSLLSNIEVQDCEALGISNIFRKLLQFFPLSVLAAQPPELLESLVHHLTTLTCRFTEHAAKEEHLDQADQVYMEAFEQVLQSWSLFLQEASSGIPTTSFSIVSSGASTIFNSVQTSVDAAIGIPNTTQSILNGMTGLKVKMKEGATLIFNTYLKCHLAPPEGVRQLVDADEISDQVLSDRQLYKDQLLLLGISARQDVQHSILLLTQLLEQRTTLLRSCLAQAAQQQQQQHTSTPASDSLYEDLHWLVLITGHVITTDAETETALIPSELVQYSVANAPHTDVQATLALLADPHAMPADLGVPPALPPQPTPTIDPLIRIVAAVLRVCETEAEALKANLNSLLSPELSSSLMWFLRRFCISYLLPAEVFYSELSVSLSSAFGRDSSCSSWVLGYLLECVERTLRLRTAEPSLVQDTVTLLVAMVDSRERGQVLLKAKSLVDLVRLQQSGHLATVSSSANRGLMQGLVLMAGAVPSDNSSREEVWQHILDPCLLAFKTVLDSPDFIKNFQEESYRKQVLHHLDNITGAAQGCLLSTAQLLFERLSPALAACVRLLDLYHNYPDLVEAILEVVVSCGLRLLCYLSPSASKRLYEVAVQLVRVYARHNIGRRAQPAGVEGEDAWRDLQLLMELLTSLLTKDFIDMAPSRADGAADGEEEEVVAAADVCLYGLNIIMPLMSRDLLHIPSLCSHYYKMVTFIAEIYPAKIGELPEDLMKNLLASIELGLTSFGPDISLYCFDFLFILTTHVFKHKGPESDIRRALQPFLKLVLDLILSQQLNSDLLQPASASLYILICCFQTEYRTLVGQLLAAQPDPSLNQRLAEAFTQLTENVELTAERCHKFRFRSNFEEFITKVRGFLFVK